jgi:hypothetical protein
MFYQLLTLYRTLVIHLSRSTPGLDYGIKRGAGNAQRRAACPGGIQRLITEYGGNANHHLPGESSTDEADRRYEHDLET